MSKFPRKLVSNTQPLASVAGMYTTIERLQSFTAATGGMAITAVAITDNTYTALDDTAVGTSGGYIKLTGTGFASGAVAYINSVACTTTFTSSTELRVVAPANTAGTVSLTAFNTTGSGAVWAAGIVYSGFPTISTSALTSSLAVSAQLVATGDAPLVFSLQGGSTLPTGVTLSSSGLLSGTITGITVGTIYTFTVLVNDPQLQTTQQLITLSVVLNDQYFNSTVLALHGDGPAVPATIEILVVAGGGGGRDVSGAAAGIRDSAGGGAGGVIYNSALAITSGAVYPLSIGTGGASATNGVSSVWNTSFTASGGGAGGQVYIAGSAGGSGGGGANYQSAAGAANQATYSGWTVYGNAGGAGLDTGPAWGAGGGGGAGAAGTAGTSATGGTGGVGISNSITGSATYYAGGGGGGAANSAITAGGLGGGGASTASAVGGAGTPNTGGGGGGVGNITGVSYAGGAGGSGVTVIAYPSINADLIISSGLTYTMSTLTRSGYKVYTFTAGTGTITVPSNNNNTFKDSSTNNFAITRTGTPTQGTFTPFSHTGWSGYFNGSTDRLTLPSSTAFDISGGTWTIEFWMYSMATPTSGNTCRMINFNTNGSTQDLTINYNSDGSIGEGGAWNNSVGIFAPAGTIVLNTWYHVAIVSNAGSAYVYVNGVLKAGPVVITQPTSGANPLYIGYDTVGTVNFAFNGYISNLRILKGNALYTNSFTPSTIPLASTQTLLADSYVTNPPTAVDYLIVAGGGGGATDIDVGGGGGGGGLLTGSTALSGLTYDVIVGAGGAQGTGPDNTGTGGGSNGTQGGNSSFNSLISIGGGYGGTRGQNGGAGGSGGGSGDNSGGGAGTAGQGYAGGTTPGMNTGSGNDSGGGGGAGGAASGATPGPGLFNAIGNATFAAGGRGAQLITPAVGAANTGNGGTGARGGGSGIVVIRYPDSYGAAITTGSPTIVVSGGYRTYTYTTNGTIAFANVTRRAVTGTQTSLLTLQDNRFKDNSTNAFAITTTGVPSTQAISPFPTIGGYSTSLVGGSIYFNGSTDWLSIPYSANLLLNGVDSTIEGWYYLNAAPGAPVSALAPTFFIQGTTSTASNFWCFADATVLYVGGSSDTNYRTVSISVIPIKQWFHLAVVYTAGTTANLYINGQSVAFTGGGGTGITAVGSNTGYSTQIGKVNAGAGSVSNFFNGYISNLRVVKGTALYTANFTPPTAPLTINAPISAVAEYLLVAGGGGGGAASGGGGGAGGLLTGTVTASGTSTVVVGTGGSAGTTSAASGLGTNSRGLGLTAIGGGGGATRSGGSSVAGPTIGGSGGGGDCNSYLTGAAGTAGQGNSGGSNAGMPVGGKYAGSGGGGAGTAGTGANTSSGASGDGGNGLSVSITGSAITYAGGGVGGADPSRSGIWGSPGTGGGGGPTGVGAAGTSTAGIAGTNGLGGGGGSGGNVASGGAGGNGIVIVAYPTSYGTLTIGSGLTYTVSSVTRSGYYVYTFTAGTDSITFPVISGTTPANLLLSGTNAAIFDQTAKNDLVTVGSAQTSATQSKFGGSAMYFNGTTDYLTATDSPNLQLGTSDFTIEFWTYMTTMGINKSFVAKGPVAGTTGWEIKMGGGNQFNFQWTATSVSGTITAVANTWYHFAVVRSGSATGNVKTYVNGVLSSTSSVAVTDNFNQTDVLKIGNDRAGTVYMNGYIDDLRITKYARYTANFTPSVTTFLDQ